MKKTFLYRFFGLGKIPAQYASAISAEGVILSDEGIKGTITYLNFRSPQRISNWKRQWYTLAIALTNTRLLAFQYSIPAFDVLLADARFGELNFSVEDETILLIAFDASLFHSDWSGNLEYRFFTPYAQDFLGKLLQKQSEQR